jgi:hypothetical protein
LKNVILPKKLTEIGLIAFEGCPISSIIVPASVNNIDQRAFGSNTSLKTVTFKKKLDVAGNIIAPFIDKNAFLNSGADTVIFNVPWAEDYDYNYTEKNGNEVIKIDPTGWGAKNYIINYNYEEA